MQRTKRTKLIAAPHVRGAANIQRNQICPCGSGKKYKNCHGLEVMRGLQARVLEERAKQQAKGK
jgi:uncharacterized protein YecA (UPF0149 family)